MIFLTLICIKRKCSIFHNCFSTAAQSISGNCWLSKEKWTAEIGLQPKSGEYLKSSNPPPLPPCPGYQHRSEPRQPILNWAYFTMVPKFLHFSISSMFGKMVKVTCLVKATYSNNHHHHQSILVQASLGRLELKPTMNHLARFRHVNSSFPSSPIQG